MIAYLYRIPSTYENVSDRIIIKSQPLESYPGTWLAAQLELPASFRVAETGFGDGFIISGDDEILTEVYPAKGLKIDGTAYTGRVAVRSGTGRVLINRVLRWQ